MARRGGYMRDAEGIEWAKLDAVQDAEAKLSAAAMGQSYYTWLNDAVAFHVYNCERFRLQQQYREDQDEATMCNTFTVDPHDPKYRPRHPKPTLTLTPGAGKGPGQSGGGARPAV